MSAMKNDRMTETICKKKNQCVKPDIAFVTICNHWPNGKTHTRQQRHTSDTYAGEGYGYSIVGLSCRQKSLNLKFEENIFSGQQLPNNE
jgi:hypothetical protein